MEFAAFSDWDQLPHSANALFARAAKESVFFSRPWFENLVENALEDGQSMLLACVVDGDSVLAMLPLIEGDDNAGNYQSLGHLYTSLFTLLIADDEDNIHQQAILACLVDGLIDLPVYSLRLAPLGAEDGRLHALQQALESRHFTCNRFFRFYNWVHRLRGQTFADYMAARPARVRNTIARKRRKLEREHGYRVRLFSVEDVARAKTDYSAVYGASWKAKELFTDFVDGLADTLATQGWLRLAVLYIGERPAAAQFWFVVEHKASIFRLAYDEQWKQYSPGSILISYLMEHVIDVDRVEEIDFLTGNDAYKQEWMSERRERCGMYCGRARRPKGRSERMLDAAGVWLRRLRLFPRRRGLPLN